MPRVLEDHSELLEVNLIVPVDVVLAEEGRQDLAHAPDLVHGLLDTTTISTTECCHDAALYGAAMMSCY